MRVGDLIADRENPRKIKNKEKLKLQKSLEKFGDFGVIVIDERNKIISGHQRVEAIIALKGEDAEVDCKRLIGYSDPELKTINIKANTHAGEWDLDKLAHFTADLAVDLDLQVPQGDPHETIKNKQMELIHYEKYNYVLIACKNEVDYNRLLAALNLEDKTILIAPSKNGGRKIKARAIWYHEMPEKFLAR